ncbi:unnamed protein product, partial [Rotaria magnacalcarata]
MMSGLPSPLTSAVATSIG